MPHSSFLSCSPCQGLVPFTWALGAGLPISPFCCQTVLQVLEEEKSKVPLAVAQEEGAVGLAPARALIQGPGTLTAGTSGSSLLLGCLEGPHEEARQVLFCECKSP